MKASYRVIILTLALMGGALATYLSVQALDVDGDYASDSDDYDYQADDYDNDEPFFDNYEYMDDENEDYEGDFLDSDDL